MRISWSSPRHTAAATAMELSPALRAAIALFATSPAAAPAFLHIYSTTTSTPSATSSATSNADATATIDRQQQPCTHLHVLDSSFNPPTTAHLALARSSLAASPPPRPPTGSSSPAPRRLLLLLSAHNADKPASPATLLERLEMMHRLSLSLGPQLPPDVGVDIGLTKHARFVDKSQALAAAYPPAQHHHHQQPPPQQPQQTFLLGFDTLVRLLDPRYYPAPLHVPCAAPLAALQPFFARARVRCTLRGEDVPAQHAYLERIRRGERLAEGYQPAWAACIELVDAPVEAVGVSSSLVRDARRSFSHSRSEQAAEVDEVLQRCLTPEVAAYVLGQGLYLDG